MQLPSHVCEFVTGHLKRERHLFYGTCQGQIGVKIVCVIAVRDSGLAVAKT